MGVDLPGFTQRVSDFIVSSNKQTLPESAFEHAKVAFMDWMAVTIAGMNEPLVEKLMRYADQLGGHAQATVLGHQRRVNVAQAALINGAMSHVLDYDDTMVVFLGHPTVTLYPGLLALAEWKDYSGEELLTAYLVGIQVGAWLGRCAGVDHYTIGWHGTSTIGRQAAAAACSKLLGLDREQTTHALGIAGTQATGLKQVFGTMCKPFHAGAAARVGVEAALLAADGFDSATDIYEGKLGFFEVLNGNPDAVSINFLSNSDDVELLTQKFHASCHCTHGPIDSARALQETHCLAPADIAGIKVYCSKISLDNASKKVLVTGLDGKFSIGYCVANALIHEDTGLFAFTNEKIKDPDVLAMMDKIEIIVDDAHRDAGLKTTCVIETETGQTFTHTMDPTSHIPDLSVKIEKIADKFIHLCAPSLGADRATALKQAIDALDHSTDIKAVVALAAVD